jgi:hypothetical protein
MSALYPKAAQATFVMCVRTGPRAAVTVSTAKVQHAPDFGEGVGAT